MQRCAVTVLHGAAGIGKTAIADMFKNFVTNRGRFSGGAYKVSCQGLRINESRRLLRTRARAHTHAHAHTHTRIYTHTDNAHTPHTRSLQH